jgi:TolB-like protein/Flp pilus assembly protein TadD
VGKVYAFEGFRLDLARGLLHRDEREIALRPKSFELLRYLVEHADRLAGKEEVMRALWPNVIVTDDSLKRCVSEVRAALGDDNHQIIKTVPRRGLRFVAPLRTVAEERPNAARKAGVLEAEIHAEDNLPILERASIAVLPFQNLSGDPGQDYFADGIVEDIITALTRVPLLSVLARNSSFARGRDPVDVRQVGRMLGARYVLEGSVRRRGAQLRVTGQLIRADNGIHLWADNFDGKPVDIFRFQDELIARVVGALLPNLQSAEFERARRKPPESLDAYDLYLRALACRNAQTREAIDEALRLLEQALALDPTFVAAAMIAGSTWALRVHAGWSPSGHAKRESLRYLRLAARLDPNGAETLATLGRIMAAFGEDREEARTLAVRSIALGPDSIYVLRNGGSAFVNLGEARTGLTYLRRALQLSPSDHRAFDGWSGIALALIQLKQDKDAVVAARNAVQQNPHYLIGLRALASSSALVGQRDEASTVVQQLLELDPNCSIAAMTERLGHTPATFRLLDGLRLAGLPESMPSS